MRMDFYQFNRYPRDTRADLVWEQGSFLAIRSEMCCSVVLYHLSSFFVEVWYSPEDNQIALVHGFERRDLLEKLSNSFEDYRRQLRDGLLSSAFLPSPHGS